MEETLGKRISANRKRLGLTQDALAERLGVTAQAVSKWENDQSCPDITMLPKLAALFGTTTDALLGVEKQTVHTGEVITESPEENEPEGLHIEKDGFQIHLGGGRRSNIAFALWLFLTGLVSLVDALRLPPNDLADISLFHIALCCAVFSFGLTGLFRRFSLLRLGCTIAGLAFIACLLTEPSIGDMDWRVPFLAGLTLFGLDQLIKSIRKTKTTPFANTNCHLGFKGYQKNNFNCDDEHFSCETHFGENDYRIDLPRLSGGTGDVSFGQMTVDLSACEEIAEDCHVELSCSFGQLTVLVPKKFQTKVLPSAAFGNVEEKGMADAAAKSLLTLSCDVNFGQITLRHI